MTDRSSTHVMVSKNGIEDWMPKTVWSAIGGNSNTEGWILVQNAPPEVVEIRQKKLEPKEEVVGVEVEEETIAVKEKVKAIKKK